jgi:putative sigma-54 modulation protein
VQIKISARHGQLNDLSASHIREKAEKLLHYFDRLMMIEVTTDLHDDLKQVEILVSAEHKHDFVARESHKELLVAADAAVHKLEQQIRKYKERIQNHRRDPSTGAGPNGRLDVAGGPTE